MEKLFRIFPENFIKKNMQTFIIDNGVLCVQDTHFREHYGYHYESNFLPADLQERKTEQIRCWWLVAIKVNQM